MLLNIATTLFTLTLIGQSAALNCFVGGLRSNSSSPAYNRALASLWKPPGTFGNVVLETFGPHFLDGWHSMDCDSQHPSLMYDMASLFGTKDADTWVCGEIRTCILDKKLIIKSCLPWVKGSARVGPVRLNRCTVVRNNSGVLIEACACNNDHCNTRIHRNFETCSGGTKVGIEKPHGLLLVFTALLGKYMCS